MAENLDVEIRVPVLIVGAGPVGLACAIELAWRGIECLVIERRDGTINHPKMNQVGVRTVEFCRRWGISQKVKDSSVPEDFPRSIRFVTATTGYQMAHYDFPARKDETCVNSPEAIQRCSQIFFDPILRDHAKSLGRAIFSYSHDLQSFEQDDDGITAKISSLKDGKTISVRADYMIACDGADSTVRDLLGIGLEGDMSLNFNVNAFFRSTDHDALFKNGRAVMQWLTDGQGIWGDIVSINGDDLWRFSLMRLENGHIPSIAEMGQHLRRAVGRDFAFEIFSILPWERRRVVAERFQAGRVLLCGDAVHQMSPTGGFGMNTGIQEAVDAAWKVAAVLQGWGGSKLVETYDIERRPVAQNIVDEAARNYNQFSRLPKGEGADEDTEAGAALRQAIGDTIYAENFDREYDMEGVPLGYRYEGSPIIVPDGTPEPPFDVMTYTPTARPGHRAPHAWLADGRSTLDLFGPGFMLLCFEEGLDLAPLVEAASVRNVPLKTEFVDDAEIASLYETKLVLVRPDGHVAWRGDGLPKDAGAMIETLIGV
ncbi:FAD-dependent monooxygenase [Pararhizobium sp. IMCC21322]|uniref:FAD-dependent monooxygenase n=1 Tax=Pararhizobium sp. IMCC21322 TaxID=3067903 RepID=UPI0027406A07|nr:FAD-dependent monooxygenase [Pararhizobium sp. IMCC21322]